MTFRLALVAVILLWLNAFPVGADPQGVIGRPIPPNKVPQNNEDLRIAYRGRVVAISDKAITLKPEGDLKITATKFLGGGATQTRIYIQDNTKPPQKFLFTDCLLHREGLLPAYRGPSGLYTGHRIADINVGDLVEIRCSQFKATDYCTGLDILRRPGGKVPPAQDEWCSLAHRLHTRMNAEQFAEETFAPKWVPWMLINLRR